MSDEDDRRGDRSVEQNVHIRRILEWFDQYRDGTLDTFGLAQNLFAISGAIEGDIPIQIRQAVYGSASEIELIHFMIETQRQANLVNSITIGFSALVRGEIPLDSWRSIFPDLR